MMKQRDYERGTLPATTKIQLLITPPGGLSNRPAI